MAAVPCAAKAQLIDGLSGWADVTVGLSTAKWKGPRVPFPVPRVRPARAVRFESLSAPLAVHGEARHGTRMLAVLRAAEAVHELTSAAGLLESFGDAGQGGTSARDIYLLDDALAAAGAYPDASGNFSALDGTRAYAVLDARLPSDRVFACTAQALIDARLLELDPAEAEILRQSSAAYFASLLTGEPLCEDGMQNLDLNRDRPFVNAVQGAEWLEQLGARQDRNRGVFLDEMWQFARQRTWEGQDLRASPDLFEAIAKALELEREEFLDVASAIAMTRARTGFAAVRGLPFAALPAFMRKVELEPLESVLIVVRLPEPRPGTRLRVWSKGDAGARFVLAAERLDENDAPLSYLQAATRKDPTSQLSVELDDKTRAVLIAVTNVGAEGIPDFDPPVTAHAVAVTVDHAM